MHNKILSFVENPLFLLIIICFLCCLPFISTGFFKSSDGELHLARISAYTYELSQGQFPVRWASTLNYSYGYPIFNFVYPLPYLLASFVYLLGFPLFISLKLILALAVFASALGMYWFGLLWLKDNSNITD